MNTRLSWIINKFTYIQIYIFICFLFLMSLVPIGSFWIKNHLDHLDAIEEQLFEIKQESILEKLLNQIQQHRLLSQQYLAGDKGNLVQLEALKDQVSQTLKDIQAFRTTKESRFVHASEISLWQKLNPIDLHKRWDTLSKDWFYLSVKENDILHTSLIREVLSQFWYFADKVGVSEISQVDKFDLVQSIFSRFSDLQEYLAQLVLVSEHILQEPKSKEILVDRLSSLIGLVASDLAYFDQGLSLYSGHHELSSDIREIVQSLSNYHDLANRLTQTIQKHIINGDQPTIYLADLQLESEITLKSGFQLWDLGFHT